MAHQFYVAIEGKQQGKFKGESKRKARKDQIEGLAFSYEVQSPRDAATGQATGKRVHKPITVVKEWGAATPQLFQALVTNEQLTSVVMEFVRTDAAGKELVFHRVTLTNAAVSDIRQHIDGLGNAHPELEDVSFTFQKIKIENLAGKTTAEDDWNTPTA